MNPFLIEILKILLILTILIVNLIPKKISTENYDENFMVLDDIPSPPSQSQDISEKLIL